LQPLLTVCGLLSLAIFQPLVLCYGGKGRIHIIVSAFPSLKAIKRAQLIRRSLDARLVKLARKCAARGRDYTVEKSRYFL
jgi:hypothetical protein